MVNSYDSKRQTNSWNRRKKGMLYQYLQESGMLDTIAAAIEVKIDTPTLHMADKIELDWNNEKYAPIHNQVARYVFNGSYGIAEYPVKENQVSGSYTTVVEAGQAVDLETLIGRMERDPYIIDSYLKSKNSQYKPYEDWFREYNLAEERKVEQTVTEIQQVISDYTGLDAKYSLEEKLLQKLNEKALPVEVMEALKYLISVKNNPFEEGFYDIDPKALEALETIRKYNNLKKFEEQKTLQQSSSSAARAAALNERLAALQKQQAELMAEQAQIMAELAALDTPGRK